MGLAHLPGMQVRLRVGCLFSRMFHVIKIMVSIKLMVLKLVESMIRYQC